MKTHIDGPDTYVGPGAHDERIRRETHEAKVLIWRTIRPVIDRGHDHIVIDNLLSALVSLYIDLSVSVYGPGHTLKTLSEIVRDLPQMIQLARAQGATLENHTKQ